MDIPEFKTIDEKLKFLVENKNTLIAQKKSQIKHADSIDIMYFDSKESAIKANNPYVPENDEIKVKIVINTTNIIDSHNDLHLPGIWNKSLKENKMLMHLQEHRMEFDKIISDGKDLKAFTQKFNWSELGYKYEGETEALIFESNIKKERNEFMFSQYSKGFVKNHSIGMFYVKMFLAVNNEGYDQEYEIWEKYYPEVANKDKADEDGYFWVIKEAKAIEGSAVPIGSNRITPTLDNNMKNEPEESTRKNIEPPDEGTQIDFKYLIDNFKL